MSKNKTNKHIENLTYYNNIITLASIIMMIATYSFLYMYVIDKRFVLITIICVLLIPLILVVNSYIHHYKLNELDIEEEYKHLKEEIDHEENIISTLPLILFGLGIIYTQYQHADYTTGTIVYLLLAVIMGYILPQLIPHIILIQSDIERLFVVEEINFFLISMTMGLLLVSMILPIYMSIRKFKS